MLRKDTLFWMIFKSLPVILFISIFIVFISSTNYRITALFDSDINWLLKTGEYIFTNNLQLPKQDLFSYTFKGSWTLYQWLYEVVIYLAYSIGGATSIGTLSTLFLAGTFTVCYLIARLYKVPFIYAVVSIIIGLLTSSVIWYARPSMMTYFFDSILLLIFLTSEIKNKKILWFIPPLFVLWANCHLGFTSGIFLLVFFVLYKLALFILKIDTNENKYLQTLLVIFILALIGTLINPYGLALYTYFFNLANIKIMNNNIIELLSPNFHQHYYYPMIVLTFLIILTSKYGKQLNLFYSFLTAFALCSSLVFTRNIPFYAIIGSITLALNLKELHCQIIHSDKLHSLIKLIFNKIESIQLYEQQLMNQGYKPTKIPVNLAIVSAFILLLITLQHSFLFQNVLAFSMDYPKYRPYYAYQYALKNKIPGKFFTEPSWGSYAIVKLYPAYSVFIDTRFDMYGEDFFTLYQNIKNQKINFNKIANDYNINWVCVAVNKNYYYSLINNKHWFLVYKDKLAAIFLRKNIANENWYQSIPKDKAVK